ncbi:MAG: tripartite tricarboxylate transporter TctB family protein [Granulosicoccus sp.]|nr:tripartite tricarboxylate transporter TctB family protein [Granulosicoccus sp.]
MHDARRRRPGELLFAIVILVFAVTSFNQSYAISGFTGKTTPGVFPMLASGTMILAAIVILIDVIRKAPPQAPVRARFIAEVTPLSHVVLIGMVLLYLIAMPYIGFIASSGLFLLAAFQFLWKKELLVTLGLTAITLIAIYVVFREVFQVVLPQGIWLRGLY